MNGKDMLEMMSELDEKVVADAAVTPIRKTPGKVEDRSWRRGCRPYSGYSGIYDLPLREGKDYREI